MCHRPDHSPTAAALVVVLAAVLGGGFWPSQRLVVGFGLVLVWVLASWRGSGSLDRVEGGFLLLLSWGAVSAIMVGAAPLASKEALTAWLVGFGLWVTARRGSGPARRMAIQVLAIGAAVVAAAVVAAASIAGSIRVGGLFENPNLGAALLLPTLPVGWMVVGAARRRVGIAWAALVSVGIVLTGSRAGLVGLIVVAAVMLPRGRLRTLGILSVAGLAAAALAWRFIGQPDVLAWHRVSIWGAVVKIWATRLLTGVGPGCLMEAAGTERILHPDQVGRYQFVVTYAESSPMAILVQLGLIGFILAVVAAALWLLAVRRSGALDATPIRAALASAAVFVVFHDLLTADPVLWWWAVLFGCVEQPIRRADVTVRPPPPAATRWAIGLGMAWLTAWGMLAPAYARVVFRTAPPTTAQIERTLRAEPWLDEAPGVRVRMLLTNPEMWSWNTAAEALHWAETALRAHPGLAHRWADVGRVRLRILTDCGGTEHDATAAELAFQRACELDPRLPWHWLEWARLERVLGRSDAAVANCLKALDQEPNAVRGWIMLARLELERGRVDSARAALNEAKTRATLIKTPGLTDYERELLEVPPAMLSSLESILANR